MPYVPPVNSQDPTNGAVILTAWGDAVNAATDYLAGTGRPRARVFNNAAISIPTSSETALTFNSERYDVGGCHSTVSNTSRLTVPAGEGGLYAFFGCIRFASNGTGERGVFIRLNGATRIGDTSVTMGSAAVATLTVYTEYQLAAADYVELSAWQTSGSGLNVEVQGNYSPEFGFRWVAS